MTVASTTNKSGPYNGNGSTTNFAVNTKYTAKSEVQVIVTSSAGVETVKTLDTHYTLTNPGDTGTVAFITAPSDHRPQSGETVTILTALAFTQATDLTSGGGLSTTVLEGACDKLTRLVQQLAEKVTRAPKLRQTTGTGEVDLPEPEAGKVLGWNADEDGLENQDSPASAVADAEAAASAAAASALAAAGSASSASTSASTASTAASNAATAETNAETAESNAETAQAAAQVAQAAAEAARDAAIAASENPAFTYNFDNATADADPGAGEFRLNNATLASVTAAYIDNADADGNTVTGWLDSFDDVGATGGRGILLIKGIDTPTAFFVGAVTGSVVDGTGYRKLTVTRLASGGTFTAGQAFSVLFTPAGATGATGPGTGDVVGPAGATNNNLAAFDTTTGKLIKDAGVSISNILTETEAAAAYQPLDADLTAIAALTTAAAGRSLLTIADPNADAVYFWDDSAGAFAALTLAAGLEINGTTLRVRESFIIACSDETTNLTTGSVKVTFRMPYAFTLTGVRASVSTAPVGSTIIVNIFEGPGTILSTKLSIDASEKTSTTAASAAVISDTALADDAEMTIDIDQVGSSTPGKGLKVTLLGYRP